MAREARLPDAVIDFIEQHHGTSLAKYFYSRALEEDRDGSVNEDNFRYDGPKPRSKETALVMLADSVEAAVRSLDTPTPEKIRDMVRILVKDKLNDGQLEMCDLTFKDLDTIAKSFNKVLEGIYHKRIEYPEIIQKNLIKGAITLETMMINQQDRVEFTPALEASLRGIADEAAQRLGISSSSELSLLLVDNEYIKELNFMYRGKDEATDVLSFAMNELGEEEPELEELDDINMLGDIVISVEQAWHQSQEYGHSLERELGYLLVHGLLHLLGYDHESEREQKLMREWEEKL